MTVRHHLRHGGICTLVLLGLVACSSSSNGTTSGADVVPGLTAKTIKVGVSVADPAVVRATFKTTGAKGISTPDESGVVKAVVQDINAHGGMAGRTVVPVVRVHKETDTSTEMEADCAAFTEDTQVFASYSTNSSAGTINQLADCLAKHKTLFVLDTRAAFDDSDFARWSPYVYAPAYLAGDRWGGIVSNLARLGYFSAGARVGLVSIDEPGAQRLLKKVVSPALAAQGVHPVDTVSVSTFSDLAGVSHVSQQVNSFVAKFKNEHIDHVMFVGTYSAASYFFPAAAERQGYHPRYAMNSSEGPAAIATNSPKGQFHGAVGVGWLPALDVDSDNDPSDNAEETRCLKVVERAGIEPGDRSAQFQTLGICNALYFMKAALDKATTVSAKDFASAVTKLGSGFGSPKTAATAFTDGRKDGVAAVRGFAFEDSCECFRYTDTSWQPLP